MSPLHITSSSQKNLKIQTTSSIAIQLFQQEGLRNNIPNLNDHNKSITIDSLFSFLINNSQRTQVYFVNIICLNGLR